MVYELDVAKWICGGGEPQLGAGPTQLLNSCGYMCCLGQFAEQKGVSEEQLLNATDPDQIDSIYDPLFVYIAPYLKTHTVNTPLADGFKDINDDDETTPIEKIALIRTDLEEHGHELKVVNEHLLEPWQSE